MKIFRHKNGYLYSIEQNGRGKTITSPKGWKEFGATPYRTNKNAPKLWSLWKNPDLKDFTFEFDD